MLYFQHVYSHTDCALHTAHVLYIGIKYYAQLERLDYLLAYTLEQEHHYYMTYDDMCYTVYTYVSCSSLYPPHPLTHLQNVPSLVPS